MLGDKGKEEISGLSASCRTDPGHRIRSHSRTLCNSRTFAGPRVFLQGLHRLLRERGDLFPQFPGISLYEVGGLRGNQS